MKNFLSTLLLNALCFTVCGQSTQRQEIRLSINANQTVVGTYYIPNRGQGFLLRNPTSGNRDRIDIISNGNYRIDVLPSSGNWPNDDSYYVSSRQMLFWKETRDNNLGRTIDFIGKVFSVSNGRDTLLGSFEFSIPVANNCPILSSNTYNDTIRLEGSFGTSLPVNLNSYFVDQEADDIIYNLSPPGLSAASGLVTIPSPLLNDRQDRTLIVEARDQLHQVNQCSAKAVFKINFSRNQLPPVFNNSPRVVTKTITEPFALPSEKKEGDSFNLTIIANDVNTGKPLPVEVDDLSNPGFSVVPLADGSGFRVTVPANFLDKGNDDKKVISNLKFKSQKRLVGVITPLESEVIYSITVLNNATEDQLKEFKSSINSLDSDKTAVYNEYRNKVRVTTANVRRQDINYQNGQAIQQIFNEAQIASFFTGPAAPTAATVTSIISNIISAVNRSTDAKRVLLAKDLESLQKMYGQLEKFDDDLVVYTNLSEDQLKKTITPSYLSELRSFVNEKKKILTLIKNSLDAINCLDSRGRIIPCQ